MVNATNAIQKLLGFGDNKFLIKFFVKKFIFILILIFFIGFSEAININEINFNPSNQTYADEYIEVYSFKGFNLTNFIICDAIDCDALLLYKFVNSSYALITTNKSNYASINASVYFVDDSRIGNGLNNDGDCVYLYYSNILIDFVCYNESVEKGNSFQLIEGRWQECSITPGYENSCEKEEEFKVYMPEFVLNKNKEFIVSVDARNKSKFYDIKIDVKSEKGERLGEIYNEKDSKWQSTYYYINSVNLTNKSFILKITSNYVGNAFIEIKIRDIASYIYPIKIVDFFVKEASEVNESLKNESEIQLLDFPEEAEENSIIKVKVNVYRGDTRKYAIYTYIYDNKSKEVVSEKTVFYANEKFKSYTVTLPIKINEIKESKNYILVVEGMDLKEEAVIFIKDIPKAEINENKNNVDNLTYYSFDNFDISFNFDKNIKKNYEIVIELKNKGKPRYFYVWSYVYSGSNCISCEESRDENYVKVFLNENETAKFKLKDEIVKDAFGFYKLKINVLEEGKKTAKGFSFDIFVNTTKVKQVEKIIFENKLIKNSDRVGYFLIALFLIILLIVVFKKEF